MNEATEERMYRSLVPNVGDLCVVKVIETNDSGSLVECLEYGNIQGLIPYSLISKKRGQNVSKLINIGKIFVAEVINVDKKYNFVDLSKKNVNETEASKKMEHYERSKRVHIIFKRLSVIKNISLKEFYETYGWKLYDKYGHADIVLKKIGKGEEIETEICNMYPELVELCKHTYKNKVVNITGKLQLNCFGIGGIDSIKKACNKAKELFPTVQIHYLHSPYYIYHIHSDLVEESISLINKAMEASLNYIKMEEGGDGNIIDSAKVSSQSIKDTFTIDKEESSDYDSE